MALAGDLVLDEVGLELAANERCPVAAHAHQSDTALGQALDRGNANLRGEAAANHHAFIEIKVDDSAHFEFLMLAVARGGSSAQAVGIDLARLLVEMVGKSVERRTSGPGPRSRCETAAGRGLLAEALSAVGWRPGAFGMAVEIHAGAPLG